MNDAALIWNSVDAFIEELFNPVDPILESVLARCDAAGLPQIQVSQAQGKFLHVLARIRGARRILEVGTLGGYSTIWLARALPDSGSLTTIELEPEHARVAAESFVAAGLDGTIDLRVGLAADVLERLAEEDREPFDFIFIDADKPSNVVYLEWAVKLAAPGAVIVLDNVVRQGAVADSETGDPKVDGSREALRWLANHPRIESAVLQTVGSKGYDGFALALLKNDASSAVS